MVETRIGTWRQGRERGGISDVDDVRLDHPDASVPAGCPADERQSVKRNDPMIDWNAGSSPAG